MGLEHHLKGLEYEKIILNHLNNQESIIRKKFLDFLKNRNEKIDPNFIFKDSSLVYNDSNSDKKTRIKPDIVSEELFFGCSIKNTRSSFQVLSSNVNVFLEKVQSFYNKKDSLFETGINKYFGTNGFGPNDLKDDNRLKQKDRNRYLFHELSDNEQKSIEIFLNNKDFLKFYLDIIWKTNQIENQSLQAKILIINSCKYSTSNKIDPIFIYTDDLIKKDIEKGFSLTKNGIILLGKNSLNIKGSGHTYDRYHSLQVKRTINLESDF